MWLLKRQNTLRYTSTKKNKKKRHISVHVADVAPSLTLLKTLFITSFDLNCIYLFKPHCNKYIFETLAQPIYMNRGERNAWTDSLLTETQDFSKWT